MLGINFFIPLTFHRNCFHNQKNSDGDRDLKKGRVEGLTEIVDAFLVPFLNKTILIINRPNKMDNLPSFYLEIASKVSSDGIEESGIVVRSCAFKVISVILYLLVFPIIIALILKLILRVILSVKYNSIIQPQYYMLPELSPKQQARIHELHIAIKKLEKDKWDKTHWSLSIAKEQLEELGLELVDTIYIPDCKRRFALVFSSGEFPGLIFKSLPLKYAKRSYVSSLISSIVIHENQWNLLRTPKVRYLESVVKNSLGEDCSLVIEEELPLLKPEPFNKFLNRPSEQVVPVLSQFFGFMSKTLFFKNDDIQLLKGVIPDSSLIMGLTDVRSVEVFPNHKQNNLVVAIDTWLKGRIDKLTVSELQFFGKILYKAFPFSWILERLKYEIKHRNGEFNPKIFTED